jgi:hypothetical protein
MPSPETNELIGYLGGAVAALTTIGVGIREYLKRDKVSNASDDSTIKGFKGNDSVLDNLVKEVARLSGRVADLESKVEHLTDKLAAVRLIALDCYQLANECECSGANKERLLTHLKQIIRDA